MENENLNTHPFEEPESRSSEYRFVYEHTESPQPQIIGQAQPASEAKPAGKKRKTYGGIVALVVICCLVSGLLGAAATGYVIDRRIKLGAYTLPTTQEDVSNIFQGDRESSVIQIHQIDTDKIMTPAEVYAVNVNSTVGITTSVTTNFWGYQTTSAASGSGFIFSDDGFILTNFHVVEDSNSITVSLYDGTTLEAKLVGYDESNDIAVLKVEAEDLVPVVLGDSENLNVGDTVIAIGNPLGELTFSLTSGTVSALNRQVTLSGGITMNLIQTDCAINSGNSGGALFNLYGEVIGITNAKYSGSSGGGATIDNIGFAIPLNRVRGIVESIIEKGYVSKPYIGVSVTDVNNEALNYGLPEGAAVRSVEQDSPAFKAGLQSNDIITHVDGNRISGRADLAEIISKAQVEQVMTLTVYRKGQTLTLTVTVGEQIQYAGAINQQNSGNRYPGFG